MTMTRWITVPTLMAVAIVALAQQDAPPTLEEGLQRLDELELRSRCEEALALAEELVAAWPDSGRAHWWRGKMRWKVWLRREGVQRHDERAEVQPILDDYARAIELDPDVLEAHISRASLETWLDRDEDHSGRWRELADRCGDLIVADPDDPRPYYLRAGLLGRLGDDGGRAADLQRVVELDPDQARAWLSLGWALDAMERQDEAEEAWQRALDLEPDYLDAVFALVHLRNVEGDYQQALALCDRAGEISPGEIRCYNLRFGIYRSQGMPQRALAEAERLIEIAPELPDGYGLKAVALRSIGEDLEGAIAALDRQEELGGLEWSVAISRGNVYMDLGEHQRAIREFQRASELNRELSMPHWRMAQAHLELEQNEQAWAQLHLAREKAEALELFHTPWLDRLEAELREAMPEPPANTDDAQQTTDEGN